MVKSACRLAKWGCTLVIGLQLGWVYTDSPASQVQESQVVVTRLGCKLD